MKTIDAFDVNFAFQRAWRYLHKEGVTEVSRNGPVLSSPGPVLIRYRYPRNRMLTIRGRRHNPFFALFETLWMLEGRDDLAFLELYNKRMRQYSDDGKFINGSAYGRRWRSWFGYNQLNAVIEELRAKPESRRVVLSQWDPRRDLGSKSKDIPCNLQTMFRMMNDDEARRLTMTVTNRSNDAIYGAFAGNMVHFSILLELMAKATGVEMGEYYHFSNNLHFYLDNPVYRRLYSLHGSNMEEPFWDEEGEANQTVVIKPWESYGFFMEDVFYFFDAFDNGRYLGDEHYHTHFFKEVVIPMAVAHRRWREGEPYPGNAEPLIDEKCDWHVAARAWLAGGN